MLRQEPTTRQTVLRTRGERWASILALVRSLQRIVEAAVTIDARAGRDTYTPTHQRGPDAFDIYHAIEDMEMRADKELDRATVELLQHEFRMMVERDRRAATKGWVGHNGTEANQLTLKVRRIEKGTPEGV